MLYLVLEKLKITASDTQQEQSLAAFRDALQLKIVNNEQIFMKCRNLNINNFMRVVEAEGS